MNLKEDIRRRFAAMFEDYRFHTVDALENGWMDAWRDGKIDAKSLEAARRRKRRSYIFDREGYADLPEQDGKALLDFVADHLAEADPTEDKIYMPVLFRWFRYGLWPEALKEATTILRRYDEDIKQGIRHEVERFTVQQMIPRKISEKPRPSPSDPLRAHNTIDELGRFFRKIDARKAFNDAARIRERDEKFLAEGSAVLFHNSSGLRIYGLKSEATREAYGKGADFQQGGYIVEKEGLYYLQVETDAGARYRIALLSCTASDEDGHKLNLMRMMREMPPLAEAMAAAFAVAEIPDWILSRGYDPVWEFAEASVHVCDKPVLPEGMIAGKFLKKYESILQKTEENIRKGPDLTGVRESEKKRVLAEHRERIARSFYEVGKDIYVLSRYPEERRQVPGDFIARLLRMSRETGCHEGAGKILAVASAVPEWAGHIPSADVAPLFAKLAEPDIDRAAAKMRALAGLFTLAARHANWRNGEEAAYLPQIFKYHLAGKNWAALKTLLMCACYRDEVGKKWRAAVPMDVRDEILSHRFDNSYKDHHIDKLMERLENVDLPGYRPFTLSATPIGEAGIKFEDQRAARLRGLRRLKKTALRQAAG